MSEEPEPADSYWDLVEAVWDSVSMDDGPEVFVEQFGRILPEQGHLFAAHWCDAEVCNGGFHQFFTNSTGVLAPEAAAGYRAVGLPQLAQLVDQAMAFFGSPYPRSQEDRARALDAIPSGGPREEWDPFYRLDEEYYRLQASESGGLYDAMDAYARRVRDDWKMGEPG
jgi:hypothetical protein